MPRLRICLLCTDVSRNAFGRAYVLARVLARDYEVQVVGPQFGASVWPPMAGLLEKHGIRVTAVPSRGYPRFLASARQLWKAIEADLVYALKPYPTSFGLGLLYRRARGVPLVLDIDDWELGTFQAMDWRRLWRTIVAGIASPNNYIWLRPLYGQIGRADAITVSSGFLRQKYGGVLVPHGRDTTAMDPARVTGDEVRRQWKLAGKAVMFLGTLRPYKGVEDLIAAVRRLGRPDVQCVVVGADERYPYTASLRALAGEQVRLLPMQPFDRIPALLAAADVVVVPQRQTRFTEAQVPAKIFDAMAMARPIVSTAVSDIPQILDGCGITVPPGDVEALAEAIAYLLDNPVKAQELGLAAREKCVREFSWDRMQSVLRQLIEQLSA
ncbi:MAG: glycosyltransferase family 4 protein [Anaerolineae bacterium]